MGGVGELSSMESGEWKLLVGDAGDGGVETEGGTGLTEVELHRIGGRSNGGVVSGKRKYTVDIVDCPNKIYFYK